MSQQDAPACEASSSQGAADSSSSTPDESTAALGARLLRTCVLLQQEVCHFTGDLTIRNAHYTPLEKWLRHLRKEYEFTERLRDEARQIEAILKEREDLEAADREKKIRLQLSASNIPGYVAKWDLVKKCSGLVGFHSTMQMVPPGSNGKRYPKRDKCHANDVFIDAIVDDGAEWLRVLGVTETRLVYQMTESGWDFGEETVHDDDSSDDDDDDEISGDECMPIVQTTMNLILAARANRFEYAYPRVHLVLPRITEGRNADIDVLLARLRRMGLCYGVDLVLDTASSPFVTSTPPSITTIWDDSYAHMLPQKYRGLSATVNLDSSILIGLASDISHGHVSTDPARHSTQNAEIDKENADPGGFLHLLYPVLAGRELVCTREAAQTFRKLTRTMATPTELARGGLLLPPEECTVRPEEFLPHFRVTSEYPVPDDLKLPVRIAGANWGTAEVEQCVAEGALPRVAVPVLRELSEPSSSVFAYGWASGLTTITSNRTASNTIKRLVERNRTDEYEKGPKVWVCSIARSLKCTPKDKDTSAGVA
ncbi:uncharacterized protein E0L32_007543 [Thyridium curvatum]|uniref:DUF1308 domain-containing protein n=1 Tax=Thyridium curvatum TaxID=1093900 RepID=A0A507AYF8_9PEZI|nr:uncharacterized protein E0L32_007543 [Thyridium curvatum]TPX11806.1 hypothetical protein E0L32_007543 [Thyridium curvatum]